VSAFVWVTPLNHKGERQEPEAYNVAYIKNVSPSGRRTFHANDPKDDFSYVAGTTLTSESGGDLGSHRIEVVDHPIDILRRCERASVEA
jgi:hypothetical protein